MRTIELQFPIEDDLQKGAHQAAREERQERLEEEHMEAEAAANEGLPRALRRNPEKLTA